MPGSTLATLSFTYTTRLYMSPPLPSLSVAYNNSVFIYGRSILPCCHHPLPRPLPATAIVRRCSTLLPIVCHCPLPPLPDIVVCNCLPSWSDAVIDRCCHRQQLPPSWTAVENWGGEDVPVPIVKFIQSTYAGPLYTKFGDDAEPKAESTKERPIGRALIWVSLLRKLG